MAESSWPFHDGVDGTPVLEDQWSYMARQWAANGVVGAPGDANLQVFANSSGREVHVRAGRASVRGHWFLSDAQETLAIAANASGNPRIDRIVLRLDPSSNEATLAVLTGTPGTVPTAPSLTQTDTGVYELTLAQVAVANGAASISALNVTDERTFTSVPYTPALSSRRPTSPVVGQVIYETDTGLHRVWNGSAWVQPYLPFAGGTLTGRLIIDDAASEYSQVIIRNANAAYWISADPGAGNGLTVALLDKDTLAHVGTAMAINTDGRVTFPYGIRLPSIAPDGGLGLTYYT